MDSITYKQNYIVKPGDVDFHKKLKLSSIMNILQELAVFGAEYLNFGKDKTLDKGYLWVFSKLEIDIFRYPEYLEEIKLATYPNQTMHFIYPRTFEIKDKDDNLIIKAKSLWCLIDANSRRILSPKETGINPVSLIKVEKIKGIDVKDATNVQMRKVRYSDLDINKHVNNIRYLEYIIDLFDSDYLSNHIIKNINMIFHHEIKEHDLVKINASIDKSYYVFFVNDNGQDKKVFECNIKFE